ncbi:hypothetical protein J132_00753 [Termitomyces sp. J132]|nr:hypothetical protein J132_00753 [Termitomyces sp. J132]
MLGRLSNQNLVIHPPMALADLDALTFHLQVHAIEKSTASSYVTGVQDYVRFCMNHNIPLDPTPQTLSQYIAYTSKYIASGPKYLTGLQHFICDFYPDFDANRSHPLVQTTIRGSKKVHADPIHRKLPLQSYHLASFMGIAQWTKEYDDFLFVTMMSCCFYVCHRSGETTDWRKMSQHSSLKFTLPYHKTNPFFHGTDILFTHQEIADPVSMLQDYVRSRDKLHGFCHALFLREDGSFPTSAWLESKLFSFVDHSFGGHSAWAGGATYYASLGISEDIIKPLGQWSSSAWTSYIWENPCVRMALQLADVTTHPLDPHTSSSNLPIPQNPRCSAKLLPMPHTYFG